MTTKRCLTQWIFILFMPIALCAWDSEPDQNGLYDGFYDRPTYFPQWEQPNTWPNAMYYLCDVRLGSENGTRVPSYEIAVYDQNNELRYCGRSLATQGHYSVLTIRGMDGVDTFHFKVLYGDDFANPTIVAIPDVTVPFVTNQSVGTTAAPFLLIVPSPFLLGDINDDGVVDVSDYIGIANHIMGMTPVGFNELAADVNGDNVIDVSDYIGVANIIMTGSVYGSRR